MKHSDSLYLFVVVVGLILTFSGVASIYQGMAQDKEVSMSGGMHAVPTHEITVTGEKHTVSETNLYSLCLNECVPAANSTAQVPAANASLEAGDLVVGLQYGRQTFAVPVSVLQWHYIMNTRLNGTPVSVAYSPHSGLARAFHPQVGDRNAAFRFSGKLWNGDMVMADTATDSYWSLYTMEAVRGPAVPTTLDAVDTDTVRWSLWKRTYPNTTVLLPNTTTYDMERYEDDPYFNYRRSTDTPTHDPYEGDQSPKTVVYGAKGGSDTVAYPEILVKDSEILHDTLGGTPILVAQNEDTGRIHGFVRQHAGDPVTFSYDADTERIYDDATGSTWALNGTAVDGPLTGTELERIPLTRMYWFSWQNFNPDSRYYTIS